jgi:cold shock CspA family protein
MTTDTNCLRTLGVVKWFDKKRGYGFITQCDSKLDYFVHFSGILESNNEYKSLCDGEYVSFTKNAQSDNKIVCVDVTGVCGGKLLSQNGKKIIMIPI